MPVRGASVYGICMTICMGICMGVHILLTYRCLATGQNLKRSKYMTYRPTLSIKEGRSDI